MTHRRFVLAPIVGIAALSFALVAIPSAEAQQVSKVEEKCNSKLGKAGRKLAATITKANAKCLEGDISGKKPASCPDAKSIAKINKIADKLVSTAEKSCKSGCSLSQDIECIEDLLCPPLPNVQNPGATELCTASGKQFRMQNINFPGAFCEGVLGQRLIVPGDIGTCASIITQSSAANLVTGIYGTLGSSALDGDKDAQKCLAGLSKTTRKLSDTIYNGVISCISDIQKGKVLGNPDTCKTADPKVAAKIQKARDKLTDTANGSCTPADIQKFDLCLNGIGGTLTVADAITCLNDMVNELTDTVEPAAFRTYGPNALTEATYPPTGGVCGDAVVNQDPDPFLLLGEECDLTDDTGCPGECFPPGDVFECTCPGPRNRYFANGFTSDLDSGWTGTSHNQGVTDGAGFFYTLEGCDCDAFTDATCTGTSVGNVCTITGQTAPSCSWDPFSSVTGTDCDGNNTNSANGVNDDVDCHICDQFSANEGAHCRGKNVAADCQAQCFDTADLDTPVGLCTKQSDCGAGEICLGTCDRTPTCVITPNGSNLPISSGGTAVCVETTFRSNVTGTNNIVTGDHAWDEFQFSKVHLGVSNLLPCPACGGFCGGGPPSLDGRPCEGTCSMNGSERCRFDEDCPDFGIGETCLGDAAECGAGGTCNLSLVCFGGPNGGSPCRVEAATRLFGTTSNDCPADPGANISGIGLEINFLPMTTGTVSLANNGCTDGAGYYGANCDDNADCGLRCNDTAIGPRKGKVCTTDANCGGVVGSCTLATCEVRPCTAVGFTNFDCPCEDGKAAIADSVNTRPNRCAMACDAGANFGEPCGTGVGGSAFGAPTVCTTKQCFGDPNNGEACVDDSGCGGIPGRCQQLACDDDADCPFGGTCDVAPTHCSGGPAGEERSPCVNNGDCTVPGTCVDACPGGRCVPLCLASTDPNFSSRCSDAPYIDCMANVDCGVAGGTCEAFTDPEEGLCAGGPAFYHCSGETFGFAVCDKSKAEGSCGSVCATSCSEAGVPSGGSMTPCQVQAECLGGEVCCGACTRAQLCGAGNDGINGNADDNPGGGICFGDVTNCFAGGGVASGVPDPTAPESNTIYCTPPTSNNSINATAGLGGPGRLRQEGVNIPMYSTLP